MGRLFNNLLSIILLSCRQNSTGKLLMIMRLLVKLNLLLLVSISIFAQTINVKIIETSDVHGAIFPYDLKEHKETKSSLARVITYVKEQRADSNQIVFLLDNGDILQGDPTVYYYNFEKTDTVHLYADVMNYMMQLQLVITILKPGTMFMISLTKK